MLVKHTAVYLVNSKDLKRVDWKVDKLAALKAARKACLLEH